MVRRFERGSGKPPLFVVNAGTLAREDGPGFVLVDLAQRRVEMHRLGEDLAVKLGSVAVL
jgi:hypothetical protein